MKNVALLSSRPVHFIRCVPLALLILGFIVSITSPAHAFCGFFVAKADASIYNQASQVIIARDGNRTVLSMFNDFQGDMKDFALVVPVPTVLQKDQVNVGEASIFNRVDDFTAPRLVEYFDNPCQRYQAQTRTLQMLPMSASSPVAMMDKKVVIEAQFTVGEYDIVILSAKESGALQKWLTDNGYKIPPKAEAILSSYIKQGLKFFVAKVNIREQAKTGYQYLRPIQFAYESDRFMLPIRLGTINAKAPQDLLAYIFTKKGRVEAQNYRTIKLPTDQEIPIEFREKNQFKDFYRAMFSEQLSRENGKAVFTEHFWDINWCDPCSAEPLSKAELKQAGVFWVEDASDNRPRPMPLRPSPKPVSPNAINPPAPIIINPSNDSTKVTRLHVRYSAESFPEDLMLFETADTTNYQGRYILRHAYDTTNNPNQCASEELSIYHQSLTERRQREAETVANLTGWKLNKVQTMMGANPAPPTTKKPPEKWWKKLWKNKE